MKQQQGAGRRPEVYFFRDQRGLEVDLLVPMGGNRLAMIEVKASASLRPEDAKAVAALLAASRAQEAHGFVVHLPRASGPPLRALRPGVRALPLDELLAALGSR